MPELKSCPRCSVPIPIAAPAGLCPTCLLRLGLENTPQPDDTPRTLDPDSTGHHPAEPTGASTVDPPAFRHERPVVAGVLAH